MFGEKFNKTKNWVRNNPVQAAAFGVGGVVFGGLFAMTAPISIPFGALVSASYGFGSATVVAGITKTGVAVGKAFQGSIATHQAILEDERNELPKSKRRKLTKKDEVHTPADEIHTPNNEPAVLNTPVPNVGDHMDVVIDQPVATPPAILFTPPPLVVITLEESIRLSDEARAKEALVSAEFNAQHPQNDRKRKRCSNTGIDLENVIERAPRVAALKAKRRLVKKD